MSSNFSNATLKDLYNGVVKRDLLLPDFQRKFEWDATKIVNLVDSIAKGISIGSIRVWDSGDYKVNTKNFGDLSAGNSESNKYVLDGQQRLTTIYYLFKDASKCKGIYINTETLHEYYKGDSENVSLTLVNKFGAKGVSDSRFVSLSDVLNEKLNMDNLPNKIVRDLTKFLSDFLSFQVQVDTMKISPKQASVIFERINTSSKSLSLLQIMVARCSLEISILEKFADLKDEITSNLKDKINMNQCEPLKLLVDVENKGLRRGSILELDPEDIKKQWPLIKASFVNGVQLLDNNGIDKGNITNNIIITTVAKFFFISEYEDLDEMSDYERKSLSLLIKESEREKIEMSSTNYLQNLMIAVQDIYEGKFTKTSDYMKSTKL